MMGRSTFDLEDLLVDIQYENGSRSEPLVSPLCLERVIWEEKSRQDQRLRRHPALVKARVRARCVC